MREKLLELRKEAVSRIKAIMEKVNTDELFICSFSEGESPIIHEDPYDDNNTYTLDRIVLEKDGSLTFESSSCCRNAEDDEGDLDLELLIGVAEWVEDKEDAIIEAYSEEEVED